jgi:hypothetical protein
MSGNKAPKKTSAAKRPPNNATRAHAIIASAIAKGKSNLRPATLKQPPKATSHSTPAPIISPSSNEAQALSSITADSAPSISEALQSTVDLKQGLLDAARHSLQVLDYSSFPNGAVLKESQVMIAANLAKELNDAKSKLRLHSQGNADDPTPGLPTSTTSKSHTATPGTAADPTFASPLASTQGSHPTSPQPLSSVNRWLFHGEDYPFSYDKSHLIALVRRANEPIDYDDATLDSVVEDIPATLLATLDPTTIDEVHALAHELHQSDARMIESRTKYELMEADGFIAKVTRTKSRLQPHASVKDDPQTTVLIDEFMHVMSIFQTQGTAVVKRYVELEYASFRKQLLPTILKGLFRLSKRMVASRKPQFQVNNILDMASLKPRDEDIPESDERLAGYMLLMLLASPSSHVIVHWAGLDSITGQNDLFHTALRSHPACPTPLSTPISTPASASATPSIATRQDSHQSRSDSKNTGDMESTTAQGTSENSMNQRSLENEPTQPDDDDQKLPGNPSFDYGPLSQESERSTDTRTVPNGQSGATLIGGQYFPLPSPRGWKLVIELTQQLRPLADHLTMGQRIHLARRITKSRCLTVAKELQIQREIFSATTSVNDLVAKSQINSSRVLAVLTQWRRSFFEQISTRLDKKLEKRLTRHAAPIRDSQHEQNPLEYNPASSAQAAIPSPDVIDLANSPKKRKASPRNTSIKRAKNTTDEAAAATPSSGTQQQQQPANRRLPAAGKQQQRQPKHEPHKQKKVVIDTSQKSHGQNADSRCPTTADQNDSARRNKNSRQRRTQHQHPPQNKPQRRNRKGANHGKSQED